MKKKIVLMGLIILIPFLLGACTDPWKGREYTFAEGFADLQKIDAKYNTSFHTEQLNKSMVPPEDIEPFIEDLKEFRENVKKTKESTGRNAVVDFVAVRITMLLAQKNFQLGERIGDIGRTNDPGGFTCGEAPYILEASNYYNKTFAYTTKARSDLDSILYQYRKVPHLQELIGLDEKKTKFYLFYLDYVSDILNTNERALTEFCRVQVVTN